MARRALRSRHEAEASARRPASTTAAGPARPRYGLDLGVRHGDTLESPHAYTLDESWRTRFARFPTATPS